MEKIKSNLHMEQMKCSQAMQFVVEEDKNISDQNPDIIKVLMENGEILIDEVRPAKDTVEIKGKLIYHILYLSDEKERRISKIIGEILWEEKVRVEGVEATDTVIVEKSIEDVKHSCINTRKINYKALVELKVKVKEIHSEEILTEIESKEIEKRKEIREFSHLSFYQNDIFGSKEEVELPQSFPAIEQLLWKSVELTRWEVKPLEDSIVIQWEATIFILYRSLGEENNINSYETTVKHNSNLECKGSNSQMIENIIPRIKDWNINIKEDDDGEDRILETEINFQLEIALYENREMEYITDVYGIQKEITPIYQTGRYKSFGEKQQLKIKADKIITLPASSPGILQVIYLKTKGIKLEFIRDEEEAYIRGRIPLQFLYLADKEEEAYGGLKEEIKFQYKIEENNWENDIQYEMYGLVQQCKTIILDKEELEIKLNLAVEIQPIRDGKEEYLKELKIEELLPAKRNQIPSMAVYRAAKEEELWEIGKKYQVPIENIKKLNQLEQEKLLTGQKILLVR